MVLDIFALVVMGVLIGFVILMVVKLGPIPGKGWWSVLRIYGPEADSFNGNWIPGDIVEIEMK